MAGPNLASLLEQLAGRFQRLEVSDAEAVRTMQLAQRVVHTVEASSADGSLEA